MKNKNKIEIGKLGGGVLVRVNHRFGSIKKYIYLYGLECVLRVGGHRENICVIHNNQGEGKAVIIIKYVGVVRE